MQSTAQESNKSEGTSMGGFFADHWSLITGADAMAAIQASHQANLHLQSQYRNRQWRSASAGPRPAPRVISLLSFRFDLRSLLASWLAVCVLEFFSFIFFCSFLLLQHQHHRNPSTMSPLPTNWLALCGSAALVTSSYGADAYAFQPAGLAGRRSVLSTAAQSSLFRQKIPHHVSATVQQRIIPTSTAIAPTSPFYSTNDDNSSDDSDTTPSPAPAATVPSMTLLERMDAVGQKLKPQALKAKDQSLAATDDKSKQVLYTLKSCFLFALFIIYRAYRGIFVLLPAVFRETYNKLESSSVLAPFVDEDDLDANQRDVNPDTGNVRFRTRATVSVLSMIVTLTYVVSGAWMVLMKMIKTLLAKGSFKSSLEAASEEFLDNESKIKRITGKDMEGDDVNGTGTGDGI